jgi:hypothetical protein
MKPQSSPPPELSREDLWAIILELRAIIEQQNARIQALEDQLSKSSRNSHKPPSSDPKGKKTKSLRRKSERPSGGQAGHEGQTLSQVAVPDEIIVHEVLACEACGEDLSGVAVEGVLFSFIGAPQCSFHIVPPSFMKPAVAACAPDVFARTKPPS